MTKYYMTLSANRIIRLGNVDFQFEPIEQFAGNWSGVLKIEDEAKAKLFSENVGRVGAYEIDELTYYNQLKKKMVFMKSSTNSLVRQSQIPISRVAKAAIKTPISPLTVTDPLPSAYDAIQVGKAPYVDPITKSVPPKQHFVKSWM